MIKFFRFLKKEFLEMLPPTTFFFIVFHIAAFLQNMMAHENGLQLKSTTVATISALIVGKAILIADAFKFLRIHENSRLIYHVIWKVFFYSLFILFIKYLEELLPKIFKGSGFLEANHHIWAELDPERFGIIYFMVCMFLFMYVFSSEVIHKIGINNFLKLIWDKQQGEA